MGKSLVILAACAAVFLALVAIDVIPLGWFDDGVETTEGYEAALGVDDDEAAGLEGRGALVNEADEDAAGLEAEAMLRAEVRGTTRNGASIRGRVVFAQGGAPAPGVTVRLRRKDSIFHYLGAEPKGRFDVLEARTGADGAFAFLDVTPSDRYVVRARLDPHAVGSTGLLDLRGREQVVLEDLRVGAGGGIAARVLHADRTPAAGVRVAATWQLENTLGVILADPSTLPEIEAEIQTDEDGRFTLTALEPGEKTIVLRAPNGASEVVRAVVVTSGDTTTADDIVLSADGFISGTVTWADGKPIAGARVFAGPSQREALRTVSTREDGSFRLGWLPEGDHYVGVLVPDMPLDLQEAGSGTDDFTAVFPVPGSVAGRIVQEGPGTPITRFSIQATQMDVSDMQARFVQALVIKALGPKPFESDDGHFDLPRLAPGEYMFDVTAPGFPRVRKTKITVVSGEATADLVIEMPRGNVARGQVQRANGAPLVGARIYALSKAVDARGPDLERAVEDLDPATTSRGDGTFELPPQAPAVYHLAVVHEHAVATLFSDVDLEKGDASGLELVTPAAGAVEGLILDASGRPASDEEKFYVLYPDGTHYSGHLDDEGRFKQSGIPVGSCVVRWLATRDTRRYFTIIRSAGADAKRAAYDELRAAGGEHYVADGETLRVTINMPRRVNFGGDLIVDGVRVDAGLWITLPDGNWGKWISTDEAGHFEFEVESGVYHVWIPDAEGEWTKDEIDIPNQREYSRDFER